MNYEYSDARKKEAYPQVYIRLKYERKYYRCEYYDGMRILYDSIPKDKYRYETRHPDDDLSYPIAIAPDGRSVIVNFCGTIVSNIPIVLSEEKRVKEILYSGDCREDYANANCYNPIKNTNPEVCVSRDNGVLRCKGKHKK